VRIIKRTKITVIRTETVFLKNQSVENEINCSQLLTTGSAEQIDRDSIIEIKAIESKDNKVISKEN
jgi:hypothetical protein